MSAFETRKKTHEVISPQEYLKRYEKDPKSVSGAKIVIPSLGKKGFGGFKVELETPVYEVVPVGGR